MKMFSAQDWNAPLVILQHKYSFLYVLILLSLFESNLLGQSLDQKFHQSEQFTQTILWMENKGQVKDQFGVDRKDVLFIGNTAGMKVMISANSISYQFEKNKEGHRSPTLSASSNGATWGDLNGKVAKDTFETYRIDVGLIGAQSNPLIEAEDPTGYYENYYNVAGYPEGILGVKAYRRIVLHNIYPGIDWVIYSQEQGIKYDFVVHPGANPALIRLKYDGNSKMLLNHRGELEISTPLGTIKESAPISYSDLGSVSSSYQLKDNVLSFKVGNYDINKTLTIDPVLVWGTFYGHIGTESAAATTTDDNGNVFLSGVTTSTIGIATNSGFQNTISGNRDAFLVKFNSSGVRQWATYYGSDGDEYDEALATDPSGNIFFSGFTQSFSNIAFNGHQNTYGGGTDDVFLVKFNAAGVRQWATYYGGTGSDNFLFSKAYGTLAVNSSGDVYLGGTTSSSDNIAAGGFQSGKGSGLDGFLVKFDGTGVRLWGTYYGGAGDDYGRATVLDANGNIYLSGATYSTNNIASGGSYQVALAGDREAYLVKFDAAGNRLWGTYYGGTNRDYANSLAVDAANNIYMAGETFSSAGIALNGHQNTFGGLTDAFFVKFNSNGNRIWATYYGGTGAEGAYLAISPSGIISLAGPTNSNSGIESNGFQSTLGGGYDGFIANFNQNGARLWGSYYGGIKDDYVWSNAVDNSGNIFLAGSTDSDNGIPLNGFKAFNGGSGDAFLAKISDCTSPVTQSVTGGGTICAGSNGVSVFLNTSESTVSYQLKLNGTTNMGAPLMGNGGMLNFGLQTNPGTYTVVATAACGSNSTMSGSAIVTVNQAPTLTGSSSVCIGDQIVLNGSGIPATSNPFVSSNSNIATVSNAGVVLGKGVGTVTITYTNDQGCKNSKVITVGQVPNLVLTGVNSNVCPSSVFALDNAIQDLNNVSNATITYFNTQVEANAGGPSTVLNPVSNSGTYWVRKTSSSNNCFDIISVNVSIVSCLCTNPPSVNIVETSVATCGVQATALNTTLSNGTGNLISSNGTGTLSLLNFTQDGNNTVTYTPSINDIGKTITITVTVPDLDGVGPCGFASDAVQIIVKPVPNGTVSISSQSVCSESAINPIELTSSVVGTSYSWTLNTIPDIVGLPNTGTGNVIAGIPNNLSTSNQTLIYTIVPTANGCVGQSVSASVSVLPLPTANAVPAVQTVCSGSDITSINLTSGVNGTSFTWTRSGSSNISNLNASGQGSTILGTPINYTESLQTVQYTILPTANGCQGPTTTAAISVQAAPKPLILGKTILCEDSIMLSELGNFQLWAWSNGKNGSTIFVNNAGTFTLTVTDINGCTGTASHTIQASNGIPSPVITGANALCAGTANLQALGNYASWLWSDNFNSVTATITIDLPGLYTVTVTDNNGCTNTAEKLISAGGPSPQPIIEGNPQFCIGDSTTLKVGSFSAYSWSNGDTSAQIIVNAPGIFSVVVTDLNGCSGTSAQVQVLELAVPQGITSTIPANCGQSNGSITLNPSGPSPFSFLWNNMSTAKDLVNVPAGTYTVTITGNNGCTQIVQATVNNLEAPQATGQVNNSTCGLPNGLINLSVTGGAPPYTYSWSNGANSPNISNIPTGIYTVTITDQQGCTFSLNKTVSGPLPISLNSVTEDCGNSNSVYSVSFILNGGTPPFIIQSGGGNINGNLFTWTGLPSGSSYNVVIKDAVGCMNTLNGSHMCDCTANAGSMQQQMLTVCGLESVSTSQIIPPVVPSGATKKFAMHKGSGNVLQEIVSWNTNPIFSYTAGMTFGANYYISAVVGKSEGVNEIDLSDPCLSVAPGTPVKFYQAIKTSIDTSICGGTVYQNGNQQFTSPGTYKIQYLTANGCDSTVQIQLIVHKPFVSLGQDQAICSGKTVFLTAQTTNCSACEFSWGASNIQVQPSTSTNFVITVTDEFGCSATDAIWVDVTAPTIIDQNEVICNGEVFTLAGVNFMQPGNYHLPVKDAQGCVDTIRLNLKVQDDVALRAVNDTIYWPQGGSNKEQDIFLLKNDQIGVGEYVLQILEKPKSGLLDSIEFGHLRYVLSNPDFNGIDSFVYELCDPICGGACSRALVKIIAQGNGFTLSDDVPNVITPDDGDKVNGVFDPIQYIISDYPVKHEECSLTIINRWGEIVFYRKPYQAWDGKSQRGKNTPIGTYYYQLKVTAGASKTWNGVINLLR